MLMVIDIILTLHYVDMERAANNDHVTTAADHTTCPYRQYEEIAVKSRLSATENFETVLYSLEMQ